MEQEELPGFDHIELWQAFDVLRKLHGTGVDQHLPSAVESLRECDDPRSRDGAFSRDFPTCYRDIDRAGVRTLIEGGERESGVRGYHLPDDADVRRTRPRESTDAIDRPRQSLVIGRSQE